MLRWWLELGSVAGAPDIRTKIAMMKPALTSAAKHYSFQHVTEGVNDAILEALRSHCMPSFALKVDENFMVKTSQFTQYGAIWQQFFGALETHHPTVPWHWLPSQY